MSEVTDRSIQNLTRAIEGLTKELKKNSQAQLATARTVNLGPIEVPPVEDEPSEESSGAVFPKINVPAYLGKASGDIDTDEDPSNGMAQFSSTGLSVKIPIEYYAQLVRDVIMKGEPFAVVVSINHKKPV